METSSRIVPAADKLAGALSYVLFFIPLMMDRRTEYTVFHMKQSFIINIFWFFGPFIPIL